MFDKKKTTLFGNTLVAPTVSNNPVTGNPFINTGLKNASRAKSGNNAEKFSSTGNSFVDQFSSLADYRKPRTYAEVSKDCATLWSQDPVMCVKFTCFVRTVSRQIQLMDGTKTEKVQKGAGLKNEAIMRMLWLAVEHPRAFWDNFNLFIAVGSWKDVFQMLTHDLEFNGWEGRVLNWDHFGQAIQAGLTNEFQTNLIKKYLPQVQARSKCTTLRAQARTMIAKWLCSTMSLTYESYRKLKRTGNCHTWQQHISRKNFDAINFDSVHGRALAQLVNSDFLKNQGLIKRYETWIMAQPTAKYTGYVHELAEMIGAPNGCRGYGLSTNLPMFKKHTINKQYEGLVQKAKQDGSVNSGLLVVRDTSGSMMSNAVGTKMSTYDIAKAMGIFFGDLLEGKFKGAWVEFSSNAILHVYKEDTFVDKWLGDKSSINGNTNFMAVANMFAQIKATGVQEADFPKGILCISDMQFDNCGWNKTNVETFRSALRSVGFSKDYCNNFQFVFWVLPNAYYGGGKPKFETFGNQENVFYLSGYSGEIITFLLGGTDSSTTSEPKTPKNAEELFLAAMDQEVLNMVRV